MATRSALIEELKAEAPEEVTALLKALLPDVSKALEAADPEERTAQLKAGLCQGHAPIKAVRRRWQENGGV
jgi:hypothetical protein